MITAVHHIAMIVSSEKCLEFYKLLGFTENFRQEREHDIVVLMDGYGVQLEVFVDERHLKRGILEPLGLRHFALKVTEPLETEIQRLKDASSDGLDIGQIMFDWVGQRFVFIHDYDGNVVELREEDNV